MVGLMAKKTEVPRATNVQSGQKATPESTSNAAAPAPAPVVLLVDDDADGRGIYADYLQTTGFATIEAGNGQEGLCAARAARPALIVMDVEMPVMDGCEALRHLRADARTCDIPIIVLSGYAQGGELETMCRGANAYLTKPCEVQRLSGVAQALIANGGAS